MPNTFVILNADLVTEKHLQQKKMLAVLEIISQHVYCLMPFSTYLGAIPFPPSIAGSRKHEATRWIDVYSTYDSAAMSRHDREGHRLMPRLRLGKIVNAEDVLRSTVVTQHRSAIIIKKRSPSQGYTYHTRCFLFGIARTAYTGPLPCWNLKLRFASERFDPKW